jgi:hypothetical protein
MDSLVVLALLGVTVWWFYKTGKRIGSRKDHLHQGRDDGEPQAGTSEAPRARGVHLLEGFEDGRPLVRRDADPGAPDEGGPVACAIPMSPFLTCLTMEGSLESVGRLPPLEFVRWSFA